MQQSPRRTRAGYTLVEVIGAVVIMAILLGAAAPVVAHLLRVRAAEAALKNDLHNAATLYEEAYVSERRYPEHLVLPVSPNVVVDSQAVRGERVYVRLRHVPTGQLCALDYSRSSAVARNRADCYGGGLARDTALTITSEPPGAPPADTFGILPPAAPPPLENPLALANPSVESGGDQTGAPGTSMMQDFVVTNRSPVSRSFRFEVGASNPAVITTVSVDPGPQVLEPNVPIRIPVRYSSSPNARADESSVIPLRVEDAGDDRWSATGAFTFSTDLTLSNPGVVVVGGSEREVDEGTETEIAWTVTNRSNGARSLALAFASSDARNAKVVGSDGAGRVPFAPGQQRTVTARVKIAGGSEGGTRSRVSLTAADAEAPEHEGSESATLETRTVLAAPVVSAPPARTADPGALVTFSWQVRNESNQARTFGITARVAETDLVESVSAEGIGDRRIGRGETQTVSVTYRLNALAVAGRVSELSLRVVDRESPEHQAEGSTTLGTNVLLAPPAVSTSSPRSSKPDGEFEVAWSVRNASNAARVISLLPTVDEGAVVSLVSGSEGGDVTFGPFESRTLLLRYRVRSDARAGTRSSPALGATDRAAPAFASVGRFDFVTAPDYRAPVWVGVPTSPMSWEEGDVRSIDFTVRNASNEMREFCVGASSASPSRIALVTPTPLCGLRIPAYDTLRVALTMRAAGAGTAVKLDAVVYDLAAPELSADTFFYNVIRATRPTAVWDAPAPVYARKWATFDGSQSWSPVGSPIVRYVWTWGLFMQRWDPAEGRFIYDPEWGTARDEVTDPSIQRAYDLQGIFEVCLTVVDAEGRTSAPNCQSITTLRPTVARLAWRYRGWWTDHDFCLDVWWDNQCEREHGNGRWEIDLRPSLGDAAIKQAYAQFRVKLHNTDDPDRSTTVTFSGNAGTMPSGSSYSFGRDYPEAVGKAQDGIWRVLSTAGTAAAGWPRTPNLADHPLVLNVNLAAATGIFDGGPHWVPDDVWVTLYVQDEHDQWTSASAYRNHDRGNWRKGYDTTVVAAAPPVASVTIERVKEGLYLARGGAESAEGRIVDRWWEVRVEDVGTGDSNTWTAREESVDLRPLRCQRITVTYTVKDDRGAVGNAVGSAPVEGGGACFDPRGGGVLHDAERR